MKFSLRDRIFTAARTVPSGASNSTETLHGVAKYSSEVPFSDAPFVATRVPKTPSTFPVYNCGVWESVCRPTGRTRTFVRLKVTCTSTVWHTGCIEKKKCYHSKYFFFYVASPVCRMPQCMSVARQDSSDHFPSIFMS